VTPQVYAIPAMLRSHVVDAGVVRQAGMTPEQALKTARVNGGDLLHKSEDIGRATPGHYADLVAQDGDPLVDIDVVIYKVRGVMVELWL
jgi:imidazolonepropionase-like amidohydrolase